MAHYARGRRAPHNLAHLKALSRQRHPALKKALKDTPLPTSYDARKDGIVGPVKDQSDCGSCWDFSGTAVAESAFYKGGILKPDGSQALSEQYTLDCGSNGGCDGDDNTTVLDWAVKTGLPLASDYGPYRASPGGCNFKPSMKLFKLKDWGFVDGSGEGVTDTNLIKAALLKYGPIGCAVAADSSWDNIGPGDTITGTSTGIDHDVAIVGWDDDHDNGDGSQGAWIMRNSWGTGWAEGGYAWVKYGADSIGTEAVFGDAGGAPSPLPVPPPPSSGFSFTLASNPPVTITVTPGQAKGSLSPFTSGCLLKAFLALATGSQPQTVLADFLSCLQS